MQIDSQSRAIEHQFAAGSARTALATSKAIRNICLLLAMTLAFSALAAAAPTVMNPPHPVLIVAMQT